MQVILNASIRFNPFYNYLLICLFISLDKNSHGLWGIFEPLVLKHNHRQGDGSEWTNILNRFREGLVTDEDFDILKERVTEDAFLDFDAMHLMYTNEEFQGHNNEMLNLLSIGLISAPAIKVYPKGRKPMIQKDGRIENRNILDVLKIKVGARCVLTVNLNTVDDLVNGATGSIVGVEYKENNLNCIIVKFDNPKWGQQHRTRYPALSAKYKANNGTPIFRYEMEIQLPSRRGKILGAGSVAKVHQFPLMINYASTAHKIQVRDFFYIF